jgi:hypothetical protein
MLGKNNRAYQPLGDINLSFANEANYCINRGKAGECTKQTKRNRKNCLYFPKQKKTKKKPETETIAERQIVIG